MNFLQLPLELENEIFNFAFGYTENIIVDYCCLDKNFLKQFFETNCFNIEKINWESVYHSLKQLLWDINFDDPIVKNMMTIIEKLEKGQIYFNNYSELLMIGKPGDCMYEIFLNYYMNGRVHNVFKKLIIPSTSTSTH